jgi:hypothetical protein
MRGTPILQKDDERQMPSYQFPFSGSTSQHETLSDIVEKISAFQQDTDLSTVCGMRIRWHHQKRDRAVGELAQFR